MAVMSRFLSTIICPLEQSPLSKLKYLAAHISTSPPRQRYDVDLRINPEVGPHEHAFRKRIEDLKLLSEWKQQHYCVFTDASRTEFSRIQKVGVGVFCPGYNVLIETAQNKRITPISFSRRIEDGTEMDLAELKGLHEGLRQFVRRAEEARIPSFNYNKDLIIFSDNENAIMKLKDYLHNIHNHEDLNTLKAIEEETTTLYENKNINIIFSYIPGHCSLPHNHNVYKLVGFGPQETPSYTYHQHDVEEALQVNSNSKPLNIDLETLEIKRNNQNMPEDTVMIMLLHHFESNYIRPKRSKRVFAASHVPQHGTDYTLGVTGPPELKIDNRLAVRHSRILPMESADVNALVFGMLSLYYVPQDEMGHINHVLLITNNEEALMSIHKNVNGNARKCMDYFAAKMKKYNVHVTLTWAPYNFGIMENRKADQLAHIGTRLNHENAYKFTDYRDLN